MERGNGERRLRWGTPQGEKLLHLVKKPKHGFKDEMKQKRKEKLL